MSIVLPMRKKRMDIFAPRKSIQIAKEKLGHAYFDPSLLECSRNAIELTKLVQVWEEIDKEKVILTRNINREQMLLRRSLKRSYSCNDKDKHKTELIASKEGIETVDGKIVAPGFRFRSNGEIKPSSLALPLVNLDDEDELVPDEALDTSNPSNTRSSPERFREKLSRKSSEYDSIDYNKEIENLQGVIDSICAELAKSKITMSEYKAKNIKTFLRAHTNDYVSATDLVKPEEPHAHSRNNRFVVQPGSSNRDELHKNRLHTPSHRTCCGCQFKLKQESDALMKIRKSRESKDALKRRWSYAPHGKYAQSSTALASNTSLANSSTTLPATSIISFHEKRAVSHCGIIKRPESAIIETELPKQSVVHFKTDDIGEHDDDKRVKSGHTDNKNLLRSKSCQGRNTKSAHQLYRRASSGQASMSSSFANRRLKSGSSATSDMGGAESTLSCRSGLASARLSSRTLVDFDSRITMLKEIQAQEDQICDMKVKDFLQKCDSKSKRSET